MESLKKNKMGTMPIFKLLVSMALPMVISMLIQSLYNVVDSIFVGKFSKDALTAVGLAWPMQNLIIAMSTGIGVGINAILSKSLGEKNNVKASQTATNGSYIMIVVYLLFLILGLTLMSSYMNLISDNKLVIDYGVAYLRYVVIGSFGLIFSITFERFLQSTGKTFLVMIAQASGAIINIVLDPCLIFGLGFFPKLGVAGAAIATLIGQFAGCFLGLIFNIVYNKEIRINKTTLKINFKLIKEILFIGIPSAVMAAIASVLTFLFNKILLRFSDITIPGTSDKYDDLPQTVFGLYFKLNSLFFMPIFGLNNALVPIVAYNYGAKNKEKMLKAMKYSLMIVFVMMLIGTGLFLIIPKQLLAIFAESDETAKQLALVGVPCLRIICLSFLIAAFCIVIMSMFQALGNGMYSMLCSIVRQLIVLLPIAYLFSLTNKLNIVWFSFLIAEIVALTLSIFLFIKMYRAKIKPLGDTISKGEYHE